MATGFGNLDDTVPADTAFIGDGAGQIRDVKAALNGIFPAVTQEISKPTDYGTAATTQPTGDDFSLLFTDMYNIVNPQDSNSNSIPIGTVVMWSGNDWTTKESAAQALGWYLCDGRVGNGRQTPNLVSTFPKGWDGLSGGGNVGTPNTPSANIETSVPYDAGTTNPKTIVKTSILAEENLPSHRHQFVLSISESDSDAIRPSDNILASATQTMIGAAQGGGYDGEYRLAYDPSRQTTEPDAGKTSKFGNDSPTAVDVGASSAEFAHVHTVDASNVEPASVAVIFLMYCGVV
jgi:microcystin-dependent protein